MAVGTAITSAARVAVEAGYSRATIYSHWPERIDLVRAAFARYGEMPRHVPIGDLREDLRGGPLPSVKNTEAGRELA